MWPRRLSTQGCCETSADQTDQRDETDQTDQRDETDQIDQRDETDQTAEVDDEKESFARYRLGMGIFWIRPPGPGRRGTLYPGRQGQTDQGRDYTTGIQGVCR